MRISIAQKLILAFLGLTVLVLIATLGLARWSFERGFLDYVNALEQNRLESARDLFAAEYAASGGNWASMTPRRFRELLRDPVSGPPERMGDRPPAGMHPDGPGRGGRGRPDRPPPAGLPPGSPGPATALYDTNDRLIAGLELPGPKAEHFRLPVVVDDQAVGELRSVTRRRFTTPQETAFSRQQLNVSLVIGSVSLVLAGVLSLLLAKGLLAPVRRMMTNVASLSGGDYTARLNESRSDELGELMADLDHLGKTLEEQRTSRRRWLADISHELRTPLTVLSGEIEALKDGVRSFDARQVESLDQEAQRLRYLVDDLYELSVSDVGGLRYTFSNCRLKESLDVVVAAMKNRTSAQDIELEVHGNEQVSVRGDASRIDQLFRNLLENSLAYTDGPGRIEVTLSESSNVAIIEIHDTPPGASLEDCEQLFEPLFRREASRNRRTGGAGLGLAICRNIVAAHRGTVSASPSPLGGLCIRIEIPAVGEAPA